VGSFGRDSFDWFSDEGRETPKPKEARGDNTWPTICKSDWTSIGEAVAVTQRKFGQIQLETLPLAYLNPTPKQRHD